MTNLQTKITSIVEEYQEVFPTEYQKFCSSMVDKKSLQANEFASGVVNGQFAYEIPLTLYNMFDAMLSKEEKLEFQTKEMAQWFGRTFNQYSPAEKI